MDYFELAELTKSTKYIRNPDSDRNLHPRLMPDHFAAPRTPIEAVILFRELVANIDQEDYGDFMREANEGILQLKAHLEELHLYVGEVRDLIEKMQGYVQFNPNWHVESTHKRLLKDIHFLESYVGYHYGPPMALQSADSSRLYSQR